MVTPNAMTSSDIGLLRSRASELSDQLSSAVRRRSSIQQQLRGAEGKDRAGLEERLGILDKRIARLESDIDENGKTLASLPAQYAGTSTPFSGMNMGRGDPMSGNFVPVAIVFTIFVLAPIAVSISRMFWRRGSMPRVAPAPADQTERLQRMEQAIDSIAIEMERVSEGQRFVTRILAEGRPGIGAGSAQPIPVPVGEQLGARR
ncbi:MAG: hypothetical protein JWM95_359 [Gemmatimonadetes bacterium]|nr:hypothetical protein [Gemmatimonadota bacterium]